MKLRPKRFKSEICPSRLIASVAVCEVIGDVHNERVSSKACGHCLRPLDNGSSFFIAREQRCFVCAATYPPLLYRSAKTAAVVGSVLVAINVAPAVLAGELSNSMLWKIPLNYLVPFCVATWGALGNARSDRPR